MNLLIYYFIVILMDVEKVLKEKITFKDIKKVILMKDLLFAIILIVMQLLK
jgi:hypothetical protein